MSSNYMLNINHPMENRLRGLARAAREAHGQPLWAPGQEFKRHPRLVHSFMATYKRVRAQLPDWCRHGNRNFYLAHELQSAYERWIDRRIAGIGFTSRWAKEPLQAVNGNRFAQFIEHLLEPDARAERPRLVSNACSNFDVHGLFNEEIRNRTNGFLDQDMEFLDEMLEEGDERDVCVHGCDDLPPDLVIVD